MSSSILFEDELLEKNEALCPRCGKGRMATVFPDHKKKLDYKCTKCGYSIHFDPQVEIE